MRRGRLVAVLLAAFGLIGASNAAPLAKTTIEQGKVAGAVKGDVAAFLGIPYAAPPVGNLRWREPQAPASWKGVRQATAYGANCMQIITPKGHGPWTWEYSAQGKVSEDCLTVNVWTPAKVTSEKLPVLFWIHGGGYFEGSSSVAIYDGAALAKKGIVVVSLNYRLGALGFLAHPELSAESPHHVSGNYGVLDTIAALKWVQKNVAAFGGDPSHVTIWGQSAGSGMVIDLTFLPAAKGLFTGAIAESGVGIGFPMPTMKQAEQMGVDFAKAKGATTLAQLRAMSAEDILKLPAAATDFSKPGPFFMPIMDGWLLPAQYAELTAQGRFNDTPFLTGQTTNESSAMRPKFGNLTQAECDADLTRTAGAMAEKFRAAYFKPGVDCNVGLAEMLRDRGVYSAQVWMKDRLKAGKGPVFGYLYNHFEPGSDAARYGTFHSSDITYVFNTLDKTPERPFTDKDRAIAETLSSYWVNFAKTGNPNGTGLPEWPAVDPANPKILGTGDTFAVQAPLPPERAKLWEELVASGAMLGMF
jgi:para-nitrobenzyl esterase